MKQEQSVLSVIIFTYNHEKYIEQAILSVVNQKTKYTYKIVVNDDCSADQTYSIIQVLQSQYSDLIKIIHNEKNLGLNKSFENAIDSVDSKYVALLGGDDYWIVSDKIEKQVDLLENNKNISYVHTGFDTFNEETKQLNKNYNNYWKWKQPNSPEAKLCSCFSERWSFYPLASTSCFRLEILKKGIELHPNILHYPLVGEGTVINSSMCFYGEHYAFLPISTTVYTVSKKSLSHYEDPKDMFMYKMAYVELRIFVCREFNIPSDQTNKVVKYMLRELLNIAIAMKQERLFLCGVEKMDIPRFLKKRFSFYGEHTFIFKSLCFSTKIRKKLMRISNKFS